MTGFVKRGLIHASDFATLMNHNFVDVLMFKDYDASLDSRPKLNDSSINCIRV